MENLFELHTRLATAAETINAAPTGIDAVDNAVFTVLEAISAAQAVIDEAAEEAIDNV